MITNTVLLCCSLMYDQCIVARRSPTDTLLGEVRLPLEEVHNNNDHVRLTKDLQTRPGMSLTARGTLTFEATFSKSVPGMAVRARSDGTAHAQYAHTANAMAAGRVLEHAVTAGGRVGQSGRH